MSSLKAELTELFSQAFTQAGFDPQFGKVVDSQRPELGQFQCNGALAVAKQAKRNPREVAQQIVDSVSQDERIATLSLAGPGFINISLTDACFAAYLNAMQADPRLSCQKTDTPNTVVVDFGGPNAAKPMHVGHLRSAIIGDSLQRLLTFLGDTVTTDNHLGDWGTQMGMLICALRERQPDLPYFDDAHTGPYPQDPPLNVSDLETMYPQASAKCKGDPAAMSAALEATAQLQRGRPGYVALWKHFVALSVEELKRDFAELGISFDHWLGESFYGERMEKLVTRLREQGIAQESEGAWIVPVAREDDRKEIPPLLVEKSGGGFLYGTSDLATLEYRVEQFHAQEVIYVVDQRQHLHFEQVFRAARIAGIVSDSVRLEHVGFGTVNGPDGKPFKTRAGGVMRLSDLLAEAIGKARERMQEAGVAQDFDEAEREEIARMVGLAAIKFADLSNHRLSDYIFDMDKFTRFEGKTGPYLLYSAVRIKSILRNAAERAVKGSAILPPSAETERQLMLTLSKLPDVLYATRESLTPNYLCDYAYDLAQDFNRFYRDCHILREEDSARQGSWISLVTVVLAQLELLMGLVGLEIPDRM